MLLRINSLLLLVALAFSGLSAQSKQDNRDLRRDLDSYRRVTLQLDYDSLLLFMPPQMLELIPAEQLKIQLEQAFDNQELYIVLDSMTYGTVPPVKKSGDFLYALIPYTGHMEMHFKQPRDSAFLGIMVPMLAGQFGEGSISIATAPDSSLYLAVALQEKNLIAFKTAKYDSWKFIEDKRGPDVPEGSQELQMMTMFVPKEVLEASKN